MRLIPELLRVRSPVADFLFLSERKSRKEWFWETTRVQEIVMPANPNTGYWMDILHIGLL